MPCQRIAVTDTNAQWWFRWLVVSLVGGFVDFVQAGFTRIRINPASLAPESWANFQ